MGTRRSNTAANDANNEVERLRLLQQVVDELLKDQPVAEQVKAFMQAAGLPFSSDHSECMSRVILAIETARPSSRHRGGESGKDL